MDIVALVQCLQPCVTGTTLRPWNRMAAAMLGMTGRVTMLGLSRWAGTGGSYRTVPRFFSTVLPWATLFEGCFRQHGYRCEDVSLLAGDAVGATKAGTHTHGLDRFLASRDGKPLPGLACFTLSWVSTPARRSCPLRVEQGVRSDAEQAATKAQAAAKKQQPPTAKRRPGRPQGSQTPPKADSTWTPECVRLTGRLDALRHLITGVVAGTSWILDGPFGNPHALQRARQRHRHRISQRRCAAARSLPYVGPEAGRGPHVGPRGAGTQPASPGPQRDHRGKASPNSLVPGATAAQGGRAPVAWRPHRQDQPAHAGPGPCPLVQP